MRPVAIPQLELEMASQDRRERGRCAEPCEDLRCGCGSLLARLVAAGVELKCRRCKRTLLLPHSDG